eukprot:2583436-Pyramimonas_sp.AAC.1
MRHSDMTRDTYFIRPTNGHSCSGIRCPESSSMRITGLSVPWAPRYFIRGTQWENVPSILSIGLSCRADDTSKKWGRQFAHGCPYLPGGTRIQLGLSMDSVVLIMVS